MAVDFFEPLNPRLQKSQNTMREIMSNPLVLLIGLAFAVQAVYNLCDFFINLGAVAKSYEGYGWIAAVVFACAGVQILYHTLAAVGFVTLYANSKQYLNAAIKTNGAKTLFADAWVFFAYVILYMASGVLKIAAYMLNGVYVISASLIPVVVFYGFIAVYSVSFIAFATSLFANLRGRVSGMSGSVAFGVSNIVVAVITLMIFIIQDRAEVQLVAEGNIVPMIITLIIHGLMAAFAFYCKITSDNLKVYVRKSAAVGD